MIDFQNIAVVVIVAAAAGWLIWKFTRKKAGACGPCCGETPAGTGSECGHSSAKEQPEIAAPTEGKR